MSELSDVFAITGSIGSGKSTLISYLKNRGIPVCDLDRINASLLEPGRAGWKKLLEMDPELARNDLKEERSDNPELPELDKVLMARKMFADPLYRKKAEGILHPLIQEEMYRWIAAQQGLCAVEVPLLFEAGWQDRFEECWLVDAAPEVRLQRLIETRGMDKEDAKRRMSAQMPDEAKRKLASVILDNSREPDWLYKQADRQLKRRGWNG